MTPTTRAGLSTLDVLKTVAVVLMIADHVGLYFVAEPWLRVVGRGASLIFGFLIGFSTSTRVPPSWILLGLGLSLLDHRLHPEANDRDLDILITLALTRACVPIFEKVHASAPWLLVPISGALALLTTQLGAYLEYGSEVPMLAILGVAVRGPAAIANGTAVRDAIAMTAIAGASLIAVLHFSFEGIHAAGCVLIVAATVLTLMHFRREPIADLPVAGRFLVFCGRYTLWIYAVHLALFQIAAAAW